MVHADLTSLLENRHSAFVYHDNDGAVYIIFRKCHLQPIYILGLVCTTYIPSRRTYVRVFTSFMLSVISVFFFFSLES